MPCGELSITLLVSDEYDGFVKRDVSIVDQVQQDHVNNSSCMLLFNCFFGQTPIVGQHPFYDSVSDT